MSREQFWVGFANFRRILKEAKRLKNILMGALGRLRGRQAIFQKPWPWKQPRGSTIVDRKKTPNGAFGTEGNKFLRSLGERRVILRNEAGGTEGTSFQ